MDNIPHWLQTEEEPSDPNKDFPAVSHELVEQLDARFPDRCPAMDASDREVWAAVGRAEVVRFLREMSNRVKL